MKKLAFSPSFEISGIAFKILEETAISSNSYVGSSFCIGTKRPIAVYAKQDGWTLLHAFEDFDASISASET